MRIVICGSLTATNKILEVQKQLEKRNHIVEIPHGVKNFQVRQRIKNRKLIIDSEEAEEKIKYGVIKQYYDLIKINEAVLIVNPDRNGIKNYIGGNTFLEIGFAHVLGKKIYCLYPIPKMSYTPEIIATKPIVLNGDLDKIG